MPKSIVLYGPMASGKTRHGHAIAKRLGLNHVMDLDDVQLQGERLQRSGFLYLSNSPAYAQRAANLLGSKLMDIADALALIGVQYTPRNAKQGVNHA